MQLDPVRLARLLLPTLILFSACLLLPSLGCGGGGGGPKVNPVGVSVSPTTFTLLEGDTQSFAATVTNATNTGVVWSVQEGATGGSVNAAGLYSAPVTVGTYHVVATSQADPTKTASAQVQVLGLSVSPATLTLFAGDTALFHATLGSGATGGVTWTVAEASGGTISAGGLYTAPLKAGVFHVVATRADNAGLTATATVTVQAGSASGTIQ